MKQFLLQEDRTELHHNYFIMKTIIIDGNNLIHKIPVLKSLFLKDKTSSQRSLIEKVKSKVPRNDRVIFVFDGYGDFTGTDIHFSGSDSADLIIKKKIENFTNHRSLKVVSSDNEIKGLAIICGCDVQNSEDFLDMLYKNESPTGNKNINQNFIYDEPEKPERLKKKDIEEFKKLFS